MQIDPRGPRFAAALTTIVLCSALITGSSALLALQTVIFAVGAFAGLLYSPYGWLYQVGIRPRLSPPNELEDARPPRSAQGVGFAFGLVGTVGYLADDHWLGMAATGLALAAAFLNAAFGYCLGCEMYLLIRRVRSA